MNKQLCVLIVLTGALLSSCLNDPPIVSPEPPFSFQTLIENGQLISPDTFCFREPFPEQPPLGFGIVFDTVQYSFVAANPNDPFELLFLKEKYPDNGAYQAECYSINLKTQTEHLVVPQRVEASNADWGRNGWILLMYRDPSAGIDIHKVKPNGDSLIKLSSPYFFDYRPQWNQDESLIYYESTQFRVSLAKMKSDGSDVDSIPINQPPDLVYSGGVVWSPDDSRYFVRGNVYNSSFVLNPYTGDTIVLLPPLTSGIGHVQWSEDGESIYWNDNSGIYNTNIHTKETVTILRRPECKNIVFSDFYISEEIPWIYLTVNLVEPLGDGKLFRDREIRMVHLETKQHWVLQLD